MSLVAQRMRVRGFLEGIEIPIISCVIQMSINSPAAASINVVYIDEIMELKPRTMVHLFFYDYTIDEVVDLDDLKKYRLLFAGETVGISYSKSPLGRSCVLQCSDFSTNWDLCYQYMITYGPHGNFITEESAAWAGENAIFNNIVDGHAQVLAQYLERSPKTPGIKKIKGLLGGILSMIEALGGIADHRQGVNDYFTISELKNRTMQQIAAEESDDTAQRLFESKEFYQWLENGVTTLGELCTIRDMIRMLFNYIYYEVVPNTCAYYIPGTGQTDKTYAEQQSVRINRQIEEIIASLYDDKNEASATTRASNAIKYIDLLLQILIVPAKQKALLNKAKAFLKSASENNRRQKSANSQAKNLKSAEKILRDAIIKEQAKLAKTVESDRLNTLIFRPECYFVSPPRCSVIFPEHETQFSYDRSYLQEVTRLRLQSEMIFGIDSDKFLADYAYAPTTKDISLLAKKQGTYGLRALLPWEKFTGIKPAFQRMHEINYIANKRQKSLQKSLKGSIVSYKQKAANFNFFKKRFGGRVINLSTKFNPYPVCGFPALIIDKPFIINREILKTLLNDKKFDASKMTPDDVVGNIKQITEQINPPTQFLGMVQTLTHSMDSASGGSTMMVLSHARTHKITEDDFLINFQRIRSDEAETVTEVTYLDSESLVKAGDETNLKFIIGATPQDILKTLKSKNAKTIKKTKRPQLQVDGLDVIPPEFKEVIETDGLSPLLGDVTYLIVDNREMTVPVKYGTIKPGSKGPKGGIIKAIQIIDNMIVTIPPSASAVDVTPEDFLEPVGTPTNATKRKAKSVQKDRYAWRAIAIYENVKLGERIKNIPIEEILRPTWFSPLYSNLFIGEKIYTPYFGTGALVDQIVFSSPEGLSVQGLGAERNVIMDKLAQSSDLLTDVSKLSQSKLFNIPDVETAANVLAFQYGEIRRLNLDAQKFVNDYTNRPIATLFDMFGSEDLEYKKVGTKLQKVRGTSGFHSSAIANYGELLGLVENPDLDLERLNSKGTSKISRLLDPRPERRAAVKAYSDKLQGGVGQVIGLAG